MATTTHSNRKKPVRAAAKPAKAATVRKTTKTTKAITKPEAARTATRTTVVTKRTSKKDDAARAVQTPLQRLRSMHITTAVLYTLFAGLVIGFAKTLAVAVTLPIQARDDFGSKEHVVLGNSYEVLYDIEPKYILAASLLLGALTSLLIATKWRRRYETTLLNRTSGFRWTAIGLSSAALLAYVYSLAGLTDVWTLKLSAFLVFLTTMLCWLAERDNAGALAPRWLAYVLSLVTGAVAWLPLIGTFIGTSVYGEERFGWHVYAIAAVTLLGFAGFALATYRSLRPSGRQTDYMSIENSFIRTDLLTKFAVVLLTLIALK